MRELISSNVTLFTNTGIEMVCNACSAPNNLLTAAKRARLELLVSRQRRLAMITAVTVTVLAVCMSPVGLAYSVSLLIEFQMPRKFTPRYIIFTGGEATGLLVLVSFFSGVEDTTPYFPIPISFFFLRLGVVFSALNSFSAVSFPLLP